ncbi:MAG TPA: DUF1684 domain-containing protein [Acidimicrobiia bacterium]|nr:DUF1684 domain-containing protein [Acidimicrobiia bacterium]
MDTMELLEHREAKDEFFRTSHDSPLEHADRHDFGGLHYYDPNSDLVFTVAMEPGDGSEIRIPTSDEREKVYARAGRVRFEVGGEPVELTVFDTGHPGFFIPFRDQTSGETTYGAGRYLDIDPNDDGTLTIDFNYAYNPSCVYSDGYSCPIPPMENWLEVPIEAGEQMWEKAV